MEIPPQGRLTKKTPDECFNEIFPLLSMVLMANELTNFAKSYHTELLSKNTNNESTTKEYLEIKTKAAQTMKLLVRVIGCIKNYGAKVKVAGDIRSKWRESISREVLVSNDSNAAIFDVYIGPIEDFVTRLRQILWTILSDKLDEEPHTDIDRMRSMILDCFG